jgi:hypothetical protein
MKIETIKLNIIRTYCCFQLNKAEEAWQIEFSKLTPEEYTSTTSIKNALDVRDKMLKVLYILNKQYPLPKLVKFIRKHRKFEKTYNSIGEVVDNYFKKGDTWIPALLAVSVLYALEDENKLFDKEDFDYILSQYEHDKLSNSTSKHMKCATDILKSLALLDE